MAEYIEREALRLAIFNTMWWNTQNADIAYDMVESIPAADVVEVVRCKDCKWKEKAEFCNYDYCANQCLGMASVVRLKDDDFCSYGERRDTDG